MSRIFWDTNVFIYLWEGKDKLGLMAQRSRQRMLDRDDQLMTSTMTLGELLVKPLRIGGLALGKKYEASLKSTSLILPFDIDSAERYAEIRESGVKQPDAIQLACAANANVDLFITNDNRLHSLNIPGIQFIVSIDRVPI